MTVDNTDDIIQRASKEGRQVFNEGMSFVGFEDITGTYPTFGYWYASTVNKAAYGQQYHDLSAGGGASELDLQLGTPIEAVYPYNNVKETASGHILEFNDTVGSERVLIKHRSGSGIELKPDGTILISSQDRLVLTVAADATVVIEGNTNLQYKGNVDMKVNGNFNLEVAGDYNVNVYGNYFEQVDAQKRTTVEGSEGHTVKGNLSTTVTGSAVSTVLGNQTNIVKGVHKTASEGENQVFSNTRVYMSGKDKIDISSTSVNMAGQSMSVFGNTGTIGGENIIMYNMNSYSGGTVYADVSMDAPKGNFTRVAGTSAHYTTFHGSLNGTALGAVSAGSAPLGAGWGGSPTVTTAADQTNNTDETAKPTQSLLNAYLKASQKGIREVYVDAGDILSKMIKMRENTGGISDRELTIPEVRSKLRDEGNLSNTKFIQSQLEAGTLSPNYTNPIPSGIRRTTESGPNILRGALKIGQNAPSSNMFRFQAKAPGQKFTPEARYIIDSNVNITAGTLLAQGVSVGRFMGGEGDRGSLNYIPNMEKRRQIARNLQPNAEAIRAVLKEQGKFKDCRLKVVEGLYKPGPLEAVTPNSINDLALQGRAVVYELLNNTGKIDNDLSYDLAVYWKNLILFDKLILDYDTFDPTGELNTQIILLMPQMDPQYSTTFKNEIETRFNGRIQSAGELIEITG